MTDPAFPADVAQYVTDIREWFETYKIPDGKPRNVFAFDGQPQSTVSTAAVACVGVAICKSPLRCCGAGACGWFDARAWRVCHVCHVLTMARCRAQEYALKVIDTTHAMWAKLRDSNESTSA